MFALAIEDDAHQRWNAQFILDFDEDVRFFRHG